MNIFSIYRLSEEIILWFEITSYMVDKAILGIFLHPRYCNHQFIHVLVPYSALI